MNNYAGLQKVYWILLFNLIHHENIRENPGIDKIITEAKSEWKKKKFVKSASWFERAAHAYLSSGNEIKSAEMANNASVAYVKAGKPELALNILDGIEDTFQKIGNQRQYAITIGNRGAAFEALGNHEDAVQHYRLSAEIFSGIGDDDLYTYSIQAISSIQLMDGHPIEALETMRRGLRSIQNRKRFQKFLKYILDIPMKILYQQD